MTLQGVGVAWAPAVSLGREDCGRRISQDAPKLHFSTPLPPQEPDRPARVLALPALGAGSPSASPLYPPSLGFSVWKVEMLVTSLQGLQILNDEGCKRLC